STPTRQSRLPDDPRAGPPGQPHVDPPSLLTSATKVNRCRASRPSGTRANTRGLLPRPLVACDKMPTRDSVLRTPGEGQMGTFLSGPVAITGAGGHVGSVLSRRLAGLPNEVRALGRRNNLAEAFREADAVVHLAGTLQPLKGNSYEQANVETVR